MICRLVLEEAHQSPLKTELVRRWPPDQEEALAGALR